MDGQAAASVRIQDGIHFATSSYEAMMHLGKRIEFHKRPYFHPTMVSSFSRILLLGQHLLSCFFDCMLVVDMYGLQSRSLGTQMMKHWPVNLPEVVASMYRILRFIPSVSRYLAEALKESRWRRRRVEGIVRHQGGTVHDGRRGCRQSCSCAV